MGWHRWWAGTGGGWHRWWAGKGGGRVQIVGGYRWWEGYWRGLALPSVYDGSCGIFCAHRGLVKDNTSSAVCIFVFNKPPTYPQHIFNTINSSTHQYHHLNTTTTMQCSAIRPTISYAPSKRATALVCRAQQQQQQLSHRIANTVGAAVVAAGAHSRRCRSIVSQHLV